MDLWAKNNYRGIVNAVTGSGKTVLALTAVQRLEEDVGRNLKIIIVVPQSFLAYQWKEEIKRLLGAMSGEIGLYHGKRKDMSRKYMIYVVNSARYSLARHILADLDSGCAVFLIADECHHYCSSENSRIFDFYKHIDKEAPYYAMGLSATPETVNYNAITTPIGPEIYYYSLDKALMDQIISRFILYSVRLEFSSGEREDYVDLSEKLSLCLTSLRKKRPELGDMPSGRFFAQLHKIANQDSDTASIAQTALMLMYRRKTICHMAYSRPLCTLDIVNSLPAQSRIIIFCERILTVELLYRRLSEYYPKQAGLYHSKMPDNTRQDVLERYAHGTIRLLVCCRALDEGLNIPSTDAGIIVSCSMSSRQRVQRLGRILRRSPKIKQIFYLYIGESSEDRELAVGLDTTGANVPLITLRYINGAFIHTGYERLRETVMEYVIQRKHDTGLIRAITQNLDRALLRGDFLLSESICRENQSIGRSVEERNYWASVLYVVLARLGKL
ncbi:MAG: DEAD/DEAH box helicase family protein [Oscillospiraceae bacterium]|nr:DEAD/DEAH box helicase family protein [Oscillospiraceae bacterium]